MFSIGGEIKVPKGKTIKGSNDVKEVKILNKTKMVNKTFVPLYVL